VKKKLDFEGTLLLVIVIIFVVVFLKFCTGCSVLTHRTAKVTYSEGCSIVVEGLEVQRAAETARQITVEGCKTEVNTSAENRE